MTPLELQIDLPDQLAREVRAAGLLSLERSNSYCAMQYAVKPQMSCSMQPTGWRVKTCRR